MMRRIFRSSRPRGLLAALAAGAAPASAATGAGAGARGFAPRQLVVKFEGDAPGRRRRLPAGVGVRATAASALRRNPRVAYAEPNYIATASAPRELDRRIPNDPGTLDGVRRSAVVGGRLGPQAVELPRPGKAPGPAAARPRPAGSTRSTPGGTWRKSGGRAPRASRSRSSTPGSPTGRRGSGSCAAPTSPPGSSPRAMTSSTTTGCRWTKTGTAPTSPARSARRPTTGSASPASPTAPG